LHRIDFKNNVLPYFDVFQKHVEMVTFLYGEHNGPVLTHDDPTMQHTLHLHTRHI
jgi:hypothetical protein